MQAKYKHYTRTTIRVDDKIIESIKRRAEKNGRSFNKQIETILTDRVGAKDNDPIIILADGCYLWINPNGSYGSLTTEIYRRFCKTGGLPLHGEEWKDVFDSMPDMIESLGTAVCKWTDTGMLVLNPDMYVEMHLQFKEK